MDRFNQTLNTLTNTQFGLAYPLRWDERWKVLFASTKKRKIRFDSLFCMQMKDEQWRIFNFMLKRFHEFRLFWMAVHTDGKRWKSAGPVKERGDRKKIRRSLKIDWSEKWYVCISTCSVSAADRKPWVASSRTINYSGVIISTFFFQQFYRVVIFCKAKKMKKFTQYEKKGSGFTNFDFFL